MDTIDCIEMIQRIVLEHDKVKLHEHEVDGVLATDFLTTGRLPTEAECRSMLSMPDDEDVETPADVRRLFAATTDLLESAWQLRGLPSR